MKGSIAKAQAHLRKAMRLRAKRLGRGRRDSRAIQKVYRSLKKKLKKKKKKKHHGS